MAKAFVHFIVLGMFFFGMWFALSRINFVQLLHVEKITKDNEHKLGELILDVLKKGNYELQSDSVQTLLNDIKVRLCKANGIDDSSLTIHILIQDDVNAFALPDRQLIVFTGLIQYCKSAEEISGVMAHEISHIEQHHVMKKLVKEVGLSLLTTITGGESSGEIMRQTAKLLSSTAFDREQEREADVLAVHMMAKADIDPESLADFLFRLSQEKDNIPKHFEWISTHPNSQDRSAEILQLRKKESYRSRPLTNEAFWMRMKKSIGTLQKKVNQ